jgi:hypothetical protein
MRFMSKIEIAGKISLGRFYEELTSKTYNGWLPTCDEELFILIKNDEGLISRFERKDFIEIDKQRKELINKILNQ